MTPTPPSTTPSSGGGPSPQEPYRVVRKRNRVPLSCLPCRTRKKCDRSHPCGNCVRREGADTNSCNYAAPMSRKKNQSLGDSTPDDMQNRIDRLEGLVLSLMHGGANIITPSSGTGAGGSTTSPAAAASTSISSKSPAESTPSGRTDHDDEDDSDVDEGLANSLGVLKVDSEKGKSMYIGQQHWHTMLADIAEVKNYFITHKKEFECSYEKVLSSRPASSLSGPAFLLGAPRASEIELRAELPPKSSVVTLCSRYFNSMDTGFHIIHAPTFRRQLQAHWEDPSKTPLMWLGLLYSIMCLAMLSYHKTGDEPAEWKGRTLDLAAEYRLRTAQCLITADYTAPVEYTVETMLIYIFGEYSSRWDADMALWLILSLVTRCAFRMGYHRDAKWFPSLTPFQAEMRRRTWALVRMTDAAFSYQVSLPSMINDDDCDTQLPTNIFDEEFGPESQELPPARPVTEPTPIAYMITKVRLCIELGAIVRATTKVGGQVHYDEILRFDARLREIMSEMPPHLKIIPLHSSTDPVALISNRYNLDILYQKILCVLHKKYLARARQNPRYSHSRRTAIEASLATLRHMEVLHRETQPTGRLRSLRWHFNVISTKEFGLPAMLVVLELHYATTVAQPTPGSPSSETPGFWTPEQQCEMIQILESTQSIWQEMADTNLEAFKASKILQIMLDRVNLPEKRQQTAANPFGSPSDPMKDPATSLFGAQSASMGLGVPSGSISPEASGAYGDMPPPPSRITPTPFSSMDVGMTSAGETRTGLTPDYQGDMFNANRPASPFSMFTQLGGSSGDVNPNIDWDAFENYTQTMNWGFDQSFQMVTGGEEETPESGSQNLGFSFGPSA